MIKNKKAAFGLFVVVFLLVWNVLDFLYTTFITRSGYSFTGGVDFGGPLVIAIIMGFLLFLRTKDE